MRVFCFSFFEILEIRGISLAATVNIHIRPFFLLYSSRFKDRRGAVSRMGVTDGLATIGRFAESNKKKTRCLPSLQECQIIKMTHEAI